jgi:hypothetical protein
MDNITCIQRFPIDVSYTFFYCCFYFSNHSFVDLFGQLTRINKLLPSIVLQFRLIQDMPMKSRSAWSIDEFYVNHIHSHLQWSTYNSSQTNETFTFINQFNGTTIYQTKDVYLHVNSIVQFELNCSNSIDDLLRFSDDFGLTWLNRINDDQFDNTPIRFNQTYFRYTLALSSFITSKNSIRFQLNLVLSCALQYFYVGKQCPMNCYASQRCLHGECTVDDGLIPFV